MKKSKQWIHFRHRVLRNILYAVIYPYSKWKYKVDIRRFSGEKRPYLILLNHSTPFDQFFVGMSVPGLIYYMATEDIFSKGWVSSVIRWAVAPIPIKKQTTDIQAVKNCIRVAKEGGTIAIAPEGNRTYSGRTGYMNPAIAPLARKLKLPLLLYRIEGGYGAHPRWSDGIRQGKVTAGVVRVLEPEELQGMTDEELYSVIQTELFVDEACVSDSFHHKKLAEYLERMVYICPFCGLSEFESHGDLVKCKRCGREIRYLPSKEMEGVGFEFPFRFAADWYDYQCDFINDMDPMEHTETPLYRDTVQLLDVVVYKHKKVFRKAAELSLYGDRIEVDEGKPEGFTFAFDSISAVTILGRNKLNVYDGDRIIQIKGSKRFNGLKYLHLFHRFKNCSKGNSDGKFLGL